MTNTTRRPRGRRMSRALLAVATAVTLGAIGTAPAHAEPRNACSDRMNAFRAAMNEARFWLRAGDRLETAGSWESANAAGEQAAYYLGIAQSELASAEAVC